MVPPLALEGLQPPILRVRPGAVRHNRRMKREGDSLRQELVLERIRRQDGRTLLLYSWPRKPADAQAPEAEDTPPLRPSAPEGGRADV